jgi:glycosyltransferase involved in cell wall biosynthesis
LLFNLVTDADDPILGFTTAWIREVAQRVARVHVVTMRAGRFDLPSNVQVRSAGKERGYSEARRVVEFYRILGDILRRHPIHGCFSHMMPHFSVLGAPLLRACRIPLVTWIAHPALHWWIRLADMSSNRMVTSFTRAYPWRRDKLTVIGQGIDTTRFSPGDVRPEDDLVLCAGRISPVKDHRTLLRAAAMLGSPARVVILGHAANVADERNLAELRRLAGELRLRDRVAFEPGVRQDRLPEWYRRCAVHVNLTPAGFGDKVALEAMACGRPGLMANEDFGDTLGRFRGELLFRPGDPADLAAKLHAVLGKTSAERERIGEFLRSRVEQLHGLPRLAGRILEILAEERRGRSRRAAPRLEVTADADTASCMERRVTAVGRTAEANDDVV